MFRWRQRQPEPERIDTLESNQKRIRYQLDQLLAMCASAGTHIESASDDAVACVPPGLIAATHTPRPDGEPVHLTTADGREVIALVDGQGDPAEWWGAIQKALAS
jgi:hypothetical protein